MDKINPSIEDQEKTQNKTIISETIEGILQDYVSLKTVSFMELAEISKLENLSLHRKRVGKTLRTFYQLLKTMHILLELCKVDYPQYYGEIVKRQKFLEDLPSRKELYWEEEQRVRDICYWLDSTLLSPHLRTTLIRADF